MGEKFCKFCGQHTDTPCVDETDLHIYSRTVERCSDANFAYEAEKFYEDQDGPLHNLPFHDEIMDGLNALTIRKEDGS